MFLYSKLLKAIVKLIPKLQIQNILKDLKMSEDEFDNIARQIKQAGDSSSAGPEWSYENALSFIIQLLTTIGKNARTILRVLPYYISNDLELNIMC